MTDLVLPGVGRAADVTFGAPAGTAETVLPPAPSFAQTRAARHPIGVTAAVDQLIVSSLILIPSSYLVWINSSEFAGSSRLVLAALFALPAALILLRWAATPRLTASAFDPTIVALYIGVVGIGLANALLRSDYAANVLSVYGQRLYWMTLVAFFLKLAASHPRTYVLTLIRRHYLVVAAAAWLFGILWLTVGSAALPHGAIVGAGSGGPTLLAYNYYLSLAYAFEGALTPIPRFTFLYREPRILAMGFAVGVMLQVNHLEVCARGHRQRRAMRALAGLLLMFGGFVLVGSLYGLIVGGALVADMMVLRMWPGAFWRRFRRFHFAVAITGLLVSAAAYTALGTGASWNKWLSGNQDAVVQLAQSVGKSSGIVESYLRQRVTAPGALVQFPLGTGTMNLDSPRFLEQYGVPTNGGETMAQTFLQDAGVVGLLAFAVVLWRVLKVVGRQRYVVGEPEVRRASLLVAALLVVSTLVVDVILSSAQGLLLVGLLIQWRPRRQI